MEFLKTAGIWLFVGPAFVMTGLGLLDLGIVVLFREYFNHIMMLNIESETLKTVMWWVRGGILFLGMCGASDRFIYLKRSAKSFVHRAGRFIKKDEIEKLEEQVRRCAISEVLWGSTVPALVAITGLVYACTLIETSGRQAAAYAIGSIVLSTFIGYTAAGRDDLTEFTVGLSNPDAERRNRQDYDDMKRFLERFKNLIDRYKSSKKLPPRQKRKKRKKRKGRRPW